MNARISRLTEKEPSPRRPRFLREIEARGDEIGFINAVSETLAQDNVTVAVDGHAEQLADHDGGILFVGDHKNQWEFVALMDMLSKMGRSDMLNIAKFYVQHQIHLSLGRAASQLVAPVYPRLLARDRQDHINSELLNRILYKNYLLSVEESEVANAHALNLATDRLADDGVVNIFPSGSVVDARTHPWRVGVGKIITQLSEEARPDVLIAPYAMDDISRTRLIGAVALRGRGVLAAPQTMTVHLAHIQSVASLLDTLPDKDRDDPHVITDELRRQFIDHL